MMNRHGVLGERRKQISQGRPFRDFQVAVSSDLLDVCEEDGLPQASRPIGSHQRVGFGCQHRARVDRFAIAFPVVPQPGKKEQTTVNGVASFTAANVRLVKFAARQHAALRSERPAESPGRIHCFAASVKPFPLVLLSRRVIRRGFPVRRQPAPLPQLDDPVVRFRIAPDDHDIAHRVPVGFRDKIESKLSVFERLGNLSQILFHVKSMAHGEKLSRPADSSQRPFLDSVC